VNAVPRDLPEPVDRFAPGTGSELSALLRRAADRVVERAGPALTALLLSGSHATGEAVWVDEDGRLLSLSDLDLYAVMRDEAAAAAARERTATTPLADARERHAWGLSAPLEVAFVTLAGLARMPARPGTVELARSARVLAGDTAVLAALPRWEQAAISAEERLLLLENRAFELLWALLASDRAGLRTRAHHAVMKTALDLAAARTLAAGELPADAAARVSRALELGAPAGTPSWLAGAWEGGASLWVDAMSWRRDGARAVSGAEHAAAWKAAARAWCVAWWAEGGEEASGSGTPDGGRASQDAPRRPRLPADPWERVLALAARGSLARRLRRSLAFAPRWGRAGLAERLRHAGAGTPPHRIHGSATVLILAAAQASGLPDEPRLPAGALHALHALGVCAAASFRDAAREVVGAWDRQLQSGERTADLA